MQQAQLNPVGHGQALTAQLLMANQAPVMGPIKTVAPQQIRSQGVNLSAEAMNDRAFNRDFYKQQDMQRASMALQKDQQLASAALEGTRNLNALERQKLSDKSALDRLELADEKAIALEGLRNTNNLDLRKEVEKWEADERELKQNFQIEREKIASKEKGDAAKLLQTQNEDRYKREQKALNDRLDRMLEKQNLENARVLKAEKDENDRVYNRAVEREKKIYDRGQEDDEKKRDQKIEDSAGSASQARQFTKDYEQWVGGDSQKFIDNSEKSALLRLPRRPIMDDEDEVIENPSQAEYLRYVEFTNQERAEALRAAKREFDIMDNRIRNNYQMIPKMGIAGNYMEEPPSSGNPLVPGAPPPVDRNTIIDNLNQRGKNIEKRNKRAEEIRKKLAKP